MSTANPYPAFVSAPAVVGGTILFYKVTFNEGTKRKIEGGFKDPTAANAYADRMKLRGCRSIEVTSYTEAR